MRIDKSTIMHGVHNKALELGFQGHKAKEVEAVTGLNHSQYDLAKYILNYYFVWGAEAIDATPEAVQAMRDLYGFSFGYIRVALGTDPTTGQCKYTEGQVNKLYLAATGFEMHGTRNGRGGRWLGGERALYDPTEQRQPTGTLLTKEEVTAVRLGGGANEATLATQTWLNRGMEAMRAAAKEHGVKLPTRATPAQAARALAKAEAPLA